MTEAGKTTLLLKLTRELLNVAEKDSVARIPVFFPLSSWGAQQRLDDWLVEELVGRYGVLRMVAKDWIANNEILPLLDGLDTVQPDRRALCVAAINQFGHEKGLFSMAVSCRKSEYDAIGVKLKLQEAVLIQPLNREDVNTYWKRLGHPADGAKQLLGENPDLWKLIDNPLMVDIVTRAYEERPSGGFEALGNLREPQWRAIDMFLERISEESWNRRERRRPLFETYVEQMFKHREFQRGVADERYPPEEAKRWLSFLALQLFSHNRVDFYAGEIQPDWWSGADQQFLKRFQGLLYVLVGGLFFALVGGLIRSAFVALVYGLTGGLVVGLCGLAFDGTLAVPDPLFPIMFFAVEAGLVYGLILGLTTGLIVGLVSGLVYGMIAGPVVGLVVGPVVAFSIFWAMVHIATTYQSVRNSARNAAICVLLGLVIVVVAETVAKRLSGPSNDLIPFVVGLIGPMLILPFFLIFGGRTVVNHHALRVSLVRARLAPWNYSAFLDYAAELLLLYKVGGGYRFRHELLQEYFALLGREYFELDYGVPGRPRPLRPLRPEDHCVLKTIAS